MPETPPADSPTCSDASIAHAEPLPGTASLATGWLCLEQPGPWGHNAVLESQLDRELGRELSTRAEAHGIRLQLIRRPGKPDISRSGGSRRVYLANTLPGGWLRRADVGDPAQLLELDFERIAAGQHDDWGSPEHDPVLLVCTNGRRDRCCAVHGRALAVELAVHHGDLVWETTHTGGHRFAPAGVLLPTGYTYGRLDARSGEAALSAATSGKVAMDQCRGRSCWSRAGQAAELATRRAAGEFLTATMRVVRQDGVEVVVEHQDGRRWAVAVRERELDPPRPNSCGKAPVRPVTMITDEVRELAPGQR